MTFLFKKTDKQQLPSADRALPGRSEAMSVPDRHFVNGHSLKAPFPAHLQAIYFGLGCFWGAERLFWQLPGVYTTAVGYAGGYTPTENRDAPIRVSILPYPLEHQ